MKPGHISPDLNVHSTSGLFSDTASSDNQTPQYHAGKLSSSKSRVGGDFMVLALSGVQTVEKAELTLVAKKLGNKCSVTASLCCYCCVPPRLTAPSLLVQAFNATMAKLYMCPPNACNNTTLFSSASLGFACRTHCFLFLIWCAAEWRDTGVWGIITCVIDRSHALKPWYIKLFDTQTMDIKFSIEIYEHMTYDAPNPLFHTFEVKTGIMGVSFCDQAEATNFLSAFSPDLLSVSVCLFSLTCMPSLW